LRRRAAEELAAGARLHRSSHGTGSEQAPGAGRLPHAGLSAKDRPVVLAVDDATDLLALMAKALGTDYHVLTAADGGAAIAAAEGEPRPDLILLDVEMPEVSGFEVCRALKGEARTADIPIIFLTGKTEAAAQVEGFESGAVDYVTKPINAKVLLARVRLHL